MKTIKHAPKEGIDLIKEFEGCHLSAYPDPKTGRLPITIGWGSTRDLNGAPFKMGDTITSNQALLFLENDCQEIMAELVKIPYFDIMNDGQIGALLSFGYNLGKNFYGGEGFNTITARLKNKEWDLVPSALMLYVNPGTSVTAGLKRRRKAEGALWSRIQKFTTITAKVETHLKKKMSQSSSLSNEEKVSVPIGKKYRVLSITKSNPTHSKVELDYGMGTWFIFDQHWSISSLSS